MNYEIIDDVLSKEEYQAVNSHLLTGTSYYYSIETGHADAKDGGYFNRVILDQPKEVFDYLGKYGEWPGIQDMQNPHQIPGIEALAPITKLLKTRAFIRIKANMYPRTKELVHQAMHVDYTAKHQGALFFVNTNNGKTTLYAPGEEENTEINSIGNRLLLFDSSKYHSSSTCTDTDVRCTLNINYV